MSGSGLAWVFLGPALSVAPPPLLHSLPVPAASPCAMEQLFFPMRLPQHPGGCRLARREERIEKATGFSSVPVSNAELGGLEAELRAQVAAGRADGFILYLLGLVVSQG